MVAYFIRRTGDVCAVIKLHADNSEEIVQDGGLSPIEAEISCEAKMVDLLGLGAQQPILPMAAENDTPKPCTASAAGTQIRILSPTQSGAFFQIFRVRHALPSRNLPEWTNVCFHDLAARVKLYGKRVAFL
jgi:hypothetical protein